MISALITKFWERPVQLPAVPEAILSSLKKKPHSEERHGSDDLFRSSQPFFPVISCLYDPVGLRCELSDPADVSAPHYVQELAWISRSELLLVQSLSLKIELCCWVGQICLHPGLGDTAMVLTDLSVSLGWASLGYLQIIPAEVVQICPYKKHVGGNTAGSWVSEQSPDLQDS